MQQSFSFGGPPPPVAAPTGVAGKPARNLTIEAGAGTGKTTAIVAEVLRLLVEREDLAPERIVLMTFTEKAAGEIADRIRGALEELVATDSPVWPCDSPTPLLVIGDREAARRRMMHHLAGIDALRSQTIHAFCQMLLRAFPIEAGLDPQFKIIQGFERALLYDQIYAAWVEEEMRADAPPAQHAQWELLFEHAGYLGQIRDLVFSLLDRRDLLDEMDYDIGSYDEVRPELEDAIHAIRGATSEEGDEHALRVFDHVRETVPSINTLEECLAYLRPIAGAVREANLPKKGVLKDALKILRAGEKGNSLYDRLMSHRAALALVELTRRFAARLDVAKLELGLVDFDDLLLRTRALLDDPIVLARARAQFDHIFVDEFQDTDRTQARIIDKLTRDASGDYVPGKTIVVGDPKQSIYGFRRADPETYYTMTEALRKSGAERRVITDQYRSHPALLTAINAMFLRLFPEREHDPNVFRPAYNELAARAKGSRELDAPVTLLRAEHEHKDDRYLAEAEALASWIQTRASRDAEGREPDYRAFAVLFRRVSKLDVYLEALDRARIPYVLPPTRLFLDRPAPVDLLAVLRAIAFPFDRGAQISAARSAYFALTDREIAASAEPLGEGVTLRPWEQFADAMAGYREAARHRTVAGLMDLLIETTGIESLYRASIGGERHLTHLEHLRGIAFEFDQRSGGSVRQFVNEITLRRDEPEEAEPTLLDDTTNAVRIMTVHGAKGLEFDTVIMPDLAFGGGSASAVQLYAVEEPRSLVMTGRVETISANFRESPDGEKLKKISGHRDEAEMRRLFYVGVTRAKTEVLFVVSTHDDTKQQGFFKCLCESLARDRKGIAALFTDTRVVHETPIGPVAAESIPFEGATADSQPRRRARLVDATLEESLVAGPIVEAQIAPASDGVVSLSAAEVAAQRHSSRSRTIGLMLHRVLELWDGSVDPEPLLREAALEAGATAQLIAQARRRLVTLGRSPLLRRIREAETIGREWPVRYVENGVMIEKRIDRLIRENGLEVVIDYKSGSVSPERIGKDREQVSRYCDAIIALTGRPCEGVLWYLDEDRVVDVQA
jgi:ATP-dependent helicase/nuclease subunit A